MPRTNQPENQDILYVRVSADVNAWLRSTAARESNAIGTVVRRVLAAAYEAERRERSGDRG
jgi:hypothetical protein